MLKKLFKISVFVLILPILLYEGYFQLFVQRKTDKNAITSATYVDHGYYWTYPKNQILKSSNEDGETFEIVSDEFGFRNSKLEKNFIYDILLLGDSFTNAANTKEELTYVNQLRKAGLTVYNAGIDGTGTIHQLYILKDILKHIKPKLVILNFYLGNDFRDNFFCGDVPKLDEFYNNLNENINIKENTNVKKEKDIVTNIADESTKPSLLKRIKSKIINIGNKLGTFQLFYNKIYLSKKLNNDMGFYDRSEIKLMSYNENNKDLDIEKAILKTEQALHYIKTFLNQRNIQLIVVGIPSKACVYNNPREISTFINDEGAVSFFQSRKRHLDFKRPDKILESICKNQHIHYISLLKPFMEHHDQKLFYHFDSHWTYIGQRIAADVVSAQLKDLLVLDVNKK